MCDCVFVLLCACACRPGLSCPGRFFFFSVYPPFFSSSQDTAACFQRLTYALISTPDSVLVDATAVTKLTVTSTVSL